MYATKNFMMIEDEYGLRTECVAMMAALNGGEAAVAEKMMVQQKKWVLVEGDVEMAGRQFVEILKLTL